MRESVRAPTRKNVGMSEHRTCRRSGHASHRAGNPIEKPINRFEARRPRRRRRGATVRPKSPKPREKRAFSARKLRDLRRIGSPGQAENKWQTRRNRTSKKQPILPPNAQPRRGEKSMCTSIASSRTSKRSPDTTTVVTCPRLRKTRRERYVCMRRWPRLSSQTAKPDAPEKPQIGCEPWVNTSPGRSPNFWPARGNKPRAAANKRRWSMTSRPRSKS